MHPRAHPVLLIPFRSIFFILLLSPPLLSLALRCSKTDPPLPLRRRIVPCIHAAAQNADRSRALPALAAIATKILPIAAKAAPKLTSVSKLTKVPCSCKHFHLRVRPVEPCSAVGAFFLAQFER